MKKLTATYFVLIDSSSVKRLPSPWKWHGNPFPPHEIQVEWAGEWTISPIILPSDINKNEISFM